MFAYWKLGVHVIVGNSIYRDLGIGNLGGGCSGTGTAKVQKSKTRYFNSVVIFYNQSGFT